MYKQRYVFYPPEQVCPEEQTGEAPVRVQAEDLYSKEQGYGFITEQNMEQDRNLMTPELNGGFLPVPWYRMLEIPGVEQKGKGCRLASPSSYAVGETDRQIPLRFKCRVPQEGSYKVRVMLRPEDEMEDIRIFAGRRCLADCRDKLSAGEVFSCQTLIQVCGIIPRGQEAVCREHCIELAVTANQPSLSEIIIESVEYPVLYIAGDSTVADQSAQYPYAPQTSYAGWGQMMPYFVQGNLAVSNHAHSGLTTESFREEGHWAVLLERAKAGDYMIFQFGHNDQKLMHLKAREGYLAQLERYIKECRKRGIYPLLVTPVARNSWRGNDGTYNDLLKEYADVCLELGSKRNIPVLDLHRLSMEFIIRLQKEDAKKYFYPSDYTHYNDFGAQKMAAMVCQEIRSVCGSWSGTDLPGGPECVQDGEQTGYRWLARQIKDEPALWNEPVWVEPLLSPKGFVTGDVPEELEEPDRPLDPLLRAEALDMVLRRAGFFNTNVYNDFFTDIVGHEWYAGAVECGLQNGIVTREMYTDRRFGPLEPVTRLDFITFLMMAYGSRNTLPEIRPCPYDKAAKGVYQRVLSAAYQLGALAPDGTDQLKESISRQEGTKICRNLKIM